MEESEEKSLDGSSIKPVSSLRSHFEQMASSPKPKPTPSAIKAVSPKPAGYGLESSNRQSLPSLEVERPVLSENGYGSLRGRRDIRNSFGLQPSKKDDTINFSPYPSPSRDRSPSDFRLQTALPPAVNVQPPQSPPKMHTLKLSLINTQSYLSADTSTPATSGRSSPRHLRNPSRPHTPIVEIGRSPSLSGRSSRPPSPPPPRRSGEMRREIFGKPSPPPVNRAEKPKIASKPLGLKPEPGITSPAGGSSPFSTPPGSDGSPEHELPVPTLPPNKPRVVSQQIFPSHIAPRASEPPPVHHAVIGKRQIQVSHGIGRGVITPQATGDARPSLPARPSGPQGPQVREAPNEVLKLRAAAQTSMMPPPPPPARGSMERSRPNMSTFDTSSSILTPPKRVFSTPTTQMQTPPRSHGRSMTIDRTSDRTPAEFRAPPTTLSSRNEGRVSIEVAPPVSSAYIKDTLSHKVFEYPDSTHSNRRPPFFKTGTHEVPTKYDTRIYDVCGELVCTSGHLTRMWNLETGDNIMSLVHGEGIKIISVAFKPSSTTTDEGSRLWLGNNMGEIYEVDVVSQDIIATKTNAHTRRDVIKIYRHKNQMWTLDDGGTLHLWAPDSSGAPNLANSPYNSFRVPKGHTFSMVIGEELWHATGKEIRIFVPSMDTSVQFQTFTRPLEQGSGGDVTSGAIINTQPDRVYFGHADGKVSVYCRKDYSCLGTFSISLYKITSLVGAGGKLWAGFSTGMIYVYDTSVTPWAVKKDWRAHNDPLMNMIADPSSFWSLDRAQVVSLGQDNMLRVWDGLLQDDWIETQMHTQEADFCELRMIKTLVMTWNAGASTPYHLQQSDKDASFLRDLLKESGSPDILVFGFQELVDLEDKKTTAKSFFKSKKKDPSTDMEKMSHQYRDWRDHLTRCLDDYISGELYHLLYTSSMVGLFTCIFVKSNLRDRIHGICGAEVKRGMGGLHGNKGALVVRFLLDDTSMCFINCHLAAGQSSTKDRNADISAILEGIILPAERDTNVRQDRFISGGDGSMIMDHEICILNGDLNYRIDTMGRDTVVSAIKSNNFSKLLERDQLLASKRKNPWFRLRAFHELPLTFAPTYKYDVGTDTYDTSEKKRAPAWCDRLLYRGLRVKQLDYRRHEVKVSDHRPVSGTFHMVIKRISPQKRAAKWEDCHKRLLALKVKFGDEAKLHYLTNVLGHDLSSSKKLLQDNR